MEGAWVSELKMFCLWLENTTFSLINSSTALRYGSFSKKTSKKSTCVAMIRIIITFAIKYSCN